MDAKTHFEKQKYKLAPQNRNLTLMAMYFNYTISGVINELNMSGKLRKFMHVKDEILTASQVYEILSQSSSEQYGKYINSILNMFNKGHSGSYEEFSC